MMFAAAGFFVGSVYFLLFVLFCLGAQATFFGPIKYALLPQHLREERADCRQRLYRSRNVPGHPARHHFGRAAYFA